MSGILKCSTIFAKNTQNLVSKQFVDIKNGAFHYQISWKNQFSESSKIFRYIILDNFVSYFAFAKITISENQSIQIFESYLCILVKVSFCDCNTKPPLHCRWTEQRKT